MMSKSLSFLVLDLMSLSVDNPGIVVEMLSCCSDYTFSVTARNSAGPGTSSDVMFSTPEPNARKHIIICMIVMTTKGNEPYKAGLCKTQV